ncbi:MAG TPA: nodulation protein NfeD [Terracidiphilus sp.]|nr:nodulation protein NfeD [Terracidiphilus sp.]
MMKRAWGLAVAVGWVAAFVVTCGLGSPALAQQPMAPQAILDKLVLSDTIQPVTAGQLDRAIAQANSDGAQALLVELNTPGGLLDSTRGMVGAMLGSRVPVIVYVAPAGARAGSAGFFLLEAADVAAMAPGTNAGAAHPVLEFGGQPDATMTQKIENDTEAFLRSYVTKRGRNAEAADAAVHTSHSYTPEEALDQHLIDLIANNDAALVAALDGRTITRLDGTKQVLHLAGARIAPLKSSLREELLGWLVNPNIALLMLVGGALLIYLEFNSPGTIVPGALGTLMVLLAIFGLNLLPIRYTAVLLLVAALALLVLEAKVGGHGALAIAGIVCLAFGMLTLVAAPVPELRVSPLIAIAVSAAFGAITVFLLRLAIRARRMKSRLGVDAMVGSPAKAMEPLSPEGHVLVEGEIWRAVASEPIAAGAALRVVGHDHYLLRVEPAKGVHMADARG